MSAEIYVIQDLLQHHEELFQFLDEELERQRRLLAEQRKLQNVVTDDKVIE